MLPNGLFFILKRVVKSRSAVCGHQKENLTRSTTGAAARVQSFHERVLDGPKPCVKKSVSLTFAGETNTLLLRVFSFTVVSTDSNASL